MAQQPQNNPYTPQHYDLMCQLGQSCVRTRDMLQRFKAAGLDVTQQELQNEEHARIANGLKQQFFPDMP